MLTAVSWGFIKHKNPVKLIITIKNQVGVKQRGRDNALIHTHTHTPLHHHAAQNEPMTEHLGGQSREPHPGVQFTLVSVVCGQHQPHRTLNIYVQKMDIVQYRSGRGSNKWALKAVRAVVGF